MSEFNPLPLDGGHDTGAPGSLGTPGAATASLVLGIVGLTVFPLLGSVLALVFGHQARRQIRADARYSGDGLATSGIVLGWVGIGLCVAAVVLTVLIVVAGLSLT